MVKELFVSFKDNINSKITNPFFGTLIIVWLFHNYKFIYTVFTFEKTKLPGARLNFIGTLLEPWPFIINLLWCILWAIGVLLFTYILINLTRLIVLASDDILKPWGTRLVAPYKIVQKEKFDNQVKATESIQKRYDDELEAKLHNQNKVDDLDNKLKDKQKIIDDLQEKLNNALINNSLHESDLSAIGIADLQKKADEVIEKGNSSSLPDNLDKDQDNFQGKYAKRIKKILRDKDLINLFNDFSIEILKKGVRELDKDSDELLLADLITIEKEFDDGSNRFTFTEFGKELREYLLNNSLFDNTSSETFSGEYYVNINAQSNGDHEVHKSSCSYLPSSENRKYLGHFNNCRDAMKEAKKSYNQVNGCNYCNSACHTS
ncbi:hypothetical protein [Labilibaculum antarcticum]|nr:hypothetical protein [Labilibaculum antarcticum]